MNSGTKREAELDDVSPTKLKALKAARNGKNGGVVEDDSSNHKNGDEHLPDDEEEDDDDVWFNKSFSPNWTEHCVFVSFR